MADIFISYSRNDVGAARQFADAFEAHGFSVWWDDALRSGDAFDEAIEAALKAAKAVVVLWSKTSVVSRWVRAEATIADRNRMLAPVSIEPCDRPIMFELTQTADLSHWKGDPADRKWQGLVADVRRLIAQNTTLPPAAPAPSTAAPTQAPKLNILILPFVNMSGDPEQEYFTDGVSEDIITDLGKVSALSVVSRSTAFTYKGKTVAPAQIARDLKVSHILEGSVRRSGQRVRITAQLLDAATDAQLWAERFDRNLDDIFAIQDEISKAIVAALKLKLAPEEKRAIESRATTNSEAYELFLMARQFGRTGSERLKPVILRLCKRVLELDPNFAAAWAQMAFAEAEMAQRNVPGASFESALAAAKKAVAIDPNLAEGHAAVAEVIGRGSDLDIAAGEPHVLRALDLDPRSYDAHLFAGYIYTASRKWDEAIKHYEIAADLEPDSYRAAGMAVQCYKAAGTAEQVKAAARRALARCEKILAIEPDNSGALGFIVTSLLEIGEPDRAREWARRAFLFDPDNPRLQYNVACGLAGIDADLTCDIMDVLAPKVNSGWFLWMERDNDLDVIRDNPRFSAIMNAARERLAKEASETAPPPAPKRKRAAKKNPGA